MRPFLPLLAFRSSALAVLLSLTGGGLVPFASAQPGTALPSWKDQVAAVVRSARVSVGLPSVQIAIGHGDAVIFEGAYGLASLELGVPATPQTMYRTASISKWLTGTAAMQLADQGRLDLDAPIQDYCPQYPAKPWAITARQLLSHTAGVRHYENYDALLALAETPEARAAVEARALQAQLGEVTRYTDVLAPLASFADAPLLFEPGTDYAYSSFGFRVLGCVIQGAAGQPYREVLRESIFAPLGLQIVAEDAWAVVPNRAEDYQMLAVHSLRRAPFRDVSENLPAGGHLATAGDLVRFAQAFDAGRLVSPASMDVMARSPIGPNGEPIPSGYGHGVDQMGRFPGSLGHSGSQAGTTTQIVLLPEEDLSVAVMTNASGWGGTNDLIADVLAIVRCHLRDADTCASGASDLADVWRSLDAADAQAASGRPDQAGPLVARAFRHGMASGVLDESAANLLGYTYLGDGSLAMATLVFSANAEAHPDSWNAHDSLGEALTAMGRVPEAIAAYERSLALNPGNTSARGTLARLRGE